MDRVKFGYPEYGEEQHYRLANPFVANRQLLNPRHVVDDHDHNTPTGTIVLGKLSREQRERLSLKRPHKPYMSFEFYGTLYDIIQQQLSLIKNGSPFYVYATDQTHDGNWMPQRTVKIHVKSTGGFANNSAHGLYMSAFSGSAGVAPGFTEFLGGDISSSFQFAGGETAVHGDNGFDASHVVVHSVHSTTRKKVAKKPNHRIHKGYEKWIENNKQTLSKKFVNTFFRKKYCLELRLDSPSEHDQAHVYDTGKITHDPINISLQLIYMLTNGIRSAPATDAELAAINYHILTGELPPHMRLENFVSDAIVPIGNGICHVAAVLDFFHKIQSRNALTVIDSLKQCIGQMRSGISDDPNLDRAAVKQLYARAKLLSTGFITSDSADLIEREFKLLRAIPQVERLIRSQIDEINQFVFSGDLPDDIASPTVLGNLSDNTYRQAYQVIYFSRHSQLPQAMTDQQLEAFKEYTQTGVMPEFLEAGVESISLSDVSSDVTLTMLAQNRSGLFSSNTVSDDPSEVQEHVFRI